MLLSVIVPCYNGQDFILSLLDSIERCNKDILNEIELLFIDDGSTDKTLQLLRNKANEHPSLHVINKKHGGIAETRNYGLTISQGEYVTFCDQDDLCINGWLPFLQSMRDYDADLLIANYLISKGDKISSPGHIKNNKVCKIPDIKELIKRCFSISAAFGDNSYAHIPQFYPTIWNCIFKRNTLIEKGIHISSFVDYEDDWKLLTDTLFSSEIVLLNTGFWYQHSERIGSESHRSKFIKNYFPRREQLRAFYLKCLSQISISKKERIGILALFDKETLLSGFVNNRQLPFQEYLLAMKGCPCFLGRTLPLLFFTRTINEFLLIILLSSRLWRTTWLVYSRRNR